MATKPYFTYGAKASDRDLINSTVNYGGALKRYFSSLDAEIYIGGERIIDINRIDFNYTEQKLPIYGFNSFLPSRIFVGNKIVQGTFIINFTAPGYIANLLETMEEESVFSSKFDRVGISCNSLNSALFKKCFDIVIGYGGYKVTGEESINNCCQVIRGVYINGFQQILDTSGEPIYEVYSFIAKDITYTEAINESNSYNTDEEINNVEVEEEDYGIANTDEEIDNVQSNSVNNSNYIGIIAKATHSILNTSSSIAQIEFTLTNATKDDEIEDVKLTIADTQISISKTYTLTYYNNQWAIKLGKEETDKIKKKLTSSSGVACYIEFSLSRKALGKKENMNKTITMVKGSGY